MQFIIFSAQYLPTAGGVERFTKELGRTLVQKGHAVSIVTSALPGLLGFQTDEHGLEIYRLPAHLFMDGRMPVLHKGGAYAQLCGKLWRKKCDFALINTRFYPLCLWAAKQCKKRSIPAAVLEHGTKHLSLDNSILNMFGNVYEHAMMKLVMKYCKDIYGISKASTNWLCHFGIKAKGVLYNGVNTNAVKAIAKAPPYLFRQKYGLEENTLAICFVGRFIAEKGVKELVEAFKLLKSQMPTVCLFMAGQGPLQKYLEECGVPGLFLTGKLSHKECISLMAQSDIFCLPTYSEGFSSTVLEAAAAGCCIVTTPTGGSPELIKDQKSGILLKDISPAPLAKVLQDALCSPAFRQNAGELLQKDVEENFSWQAAANRFLEIANSGVNK